MSTERVMDLILAQANGDFDRESLIDEVDLRAAAQDITDEFILVRRSYLPLVVTAEDHDGKTLFCLSSGEEFSISSDPDEARDFALKRLAAAEFLEERHQQRTNTDARCNELAREFGGARNWTYHNVAATTQAAIDRIIELEARVAP